MALSKVINFQDKTEQQEQQNEIKEVLNLKPIQLHTLIERSNEIQSHCSDYMVREADHTNMLFDEDCSLRYMPEAGGLRVAQMSPYALSQLCNKIGVPTQYIVKCMDNGRIDLARENVNEWLGDYGKDLFIREYERNGMDTVRGVLSSKFAVCDTPDILNVIDDVLDLDRFKIKGSFMNEERLHLRLVEKTTLPIVGEDLFAGMTIDSSDIGRSKLSVNFFIFKQICTNGLCVSTGQGQLFSQKHVGITSQEFHEEFMASMKNYEELVEKISEYIMASKNSKTMVSKKMSGEVLENMIARIKNSTKLSDDGANKVIQLMTDGTYDTSRWGMINAITQVAQDYTLERRIELERIAGAMLVA